MTAVILLFASAMAVAQEQDVGSRSQRPIPAPVEFRCAPKVLTATDTLTLTFSGPHGAELGVWAPDTRFLFIAFVQETPQSVPPIRGEEFAQMRSLKLSVKGATGLDYIGSSEPRVIFSVPGTYRFILADNLETEAAFGGHQPCEVRFASKADAGRGTKAQSVLTSGRAVAALSKARPGTDWKRSLRSDVDCDGTLDDVFIAQDTTEFHVGVVFAGGAVEEPRVSIVSFELEGFSQDSLCGVPKPLKEESLDLDPDEDPAIPVGLRRSKTCKGLRLDSGDCDAFHLFWDHKARILDWWRR